MKLSPSTLTQAQVLAAIKALAVADLDITHVNIRDQLISSGFQPTATDLMMTNSKTFAWLKALSAHLANLRKQGEIEVLNPGVRKGLKYHLVGHLASPPEKTKQITLPEYSSTEHIAQIAADLAETKELLQKLLRVVTEPNPEPEPQPVHNGNGKNGRGTVEAVIEQELKNSNGRR